MKLTFETLSPYEKEILKVRAHSIYTNNKYADAPMCVVEATFELINSMGYDIVKSDRSNNVVKNPVVEEDPKLKRGYWYK